MSTNYGRTTVGGDTVVNNVGTDNQYGFLVTGVPAGIVTALDVYMAGHGGTCRTILVLWDSGGNVVAQSAQFTVGAGTGGLNGQSVQRAVLSSPVAIAAGSYYVGFWRNGSDSAEFSYQSGSGSIHPNAPSGGIANVGSPSHLDGSTGTTGSMTAYLEWQAAGVHVYDGSAWQACPVYIYDGSAWQLSNGVYVYDGSAWQLVN